MKNNVITVLVLAVLLSVFAYLFANAFHEVLNSFFQPADSVVADEYEEFNPIDGHSFDQEISGAALHNALDGTSLEDMQETCERLNIECEFVLLLEEEVEHWSTGAPPDLSD